MNLLKKGLVPAAAAFVLLFGCEQAEVKPTSVDDVVGVTEEYALVNKLFNDASNAGDDAVLTAEIGAGNSGGRIANDGGPSITVEPADFTTFPKTITVDFKDGMTGKDGVVRKGKVIITSTDWHGVTGSIHTAVFDNYYQNGNKIEGTHKETNIGPDEDNSQKFQVEIRDGVVTTEGGEKIFYNQDTYRTLIAGADTPLNIWDNEYLIEGVQDGVSSSEIEFSVETIEPLHFKVVPRGVYAGILSVDIGIYKNIELNYNNSTVTFLGQTYPFAN